LQLASGLRYPPGGQGTAPVEYICLCNGITDEEVKRAICCGARRPKEVYEAAGYRAQCGKCTRDILAVIRSAPAPLAELRA
jgi:bacterioferritin-associated ferredoxin